MSQKIKLYKPVLSLLTITSILLVSGCTHKESNKHEEEIQNVYEEEIQNTYEEDDERVSCHHLTVYFGNETITFKECDGYDIFNTYASYSGVIEYRISKHGELIMFGTTNQYNNYWINHNIDNEQLNVESIQKTKRIVDSQ